MLTYAVRDITALCDPAAAAEAIASLPAALRPRVEAVKKPLEKARRLGGLLLLCEQYEALQIGALPPIAHTVLGKPYFTEGSLHFSLSHAGNLAACALADAPVGIDLEPYPAAAPAGGATLRLGGVAQTPARLLALASRWFTPAEQASLANSLSPREKGTPQAEEGEPQRRHRDSFPPCEDFYRGKKEICCSTVSPPHQSATLTASPAGGSQGTREKGTPQAEEGDFSPSLASAEAASPATVRGFLEIWVRKEALVKRDGLGGRALAHTDTTAAPLALETTVRDDGGNCYFLAIAR